MKTRKINRIQELELKIADLGRAIAELQQQLAERDKIWRQWLDDYLDGGPGPDVRRDPDIDYGRGPGFNPNHLHHEQ